jgi:hypothetical protein
MTHLKRIGEQLPNFGVNYCSVRRMTLYGSSCQQQEGFVFSLMWIIFVMSSPVAATAKKPSLTQRKAALKEE